jgi:hypothetical protein
MFKNLVKIANKLDSLGLTKEADVLDRYIKKVAALPDPGGTYGYAGTQKYVPPGNLPELMKKWLDTATLDGGFLGAFAQTLPTNKIQTVRSAISEIRAILAEIKGASLSVMDRVAFLDWYGKNIEMTFIAGKARGSHDNVTNDLIELADQIEAMSKHAQFNRMIYDQETHTPIAKLEDLYAPIVKEIRATAEMWRDSFSKADPSETPKVPSVPKKTEPQVAMESTTTYPPYKEPKSALTGWDKYMAVTKYGPSVQRAWFDFVKTDPPEIGMDKSFGAYKQWYKDRLTTDWKGAHKSEDEIIRLLKLEAKMNAAGDYTSPRV